MTQQNQVDQTNKLVWAYMVENGILTNGKWSYYAGNWERTTGWDWRESDREMAEFRSRLKSVGVDWSRTAPPESSLENAFTDTFSDSDSVETLLGTIVLKDGSEYIVGVSNSDVRFGAYVKMISALIADTERVNAIFGD